MFTASTTCGRLVLSAATLTSIRPRATEDSSSSSTTLMTGTIYLNCLVTCSMTISLASTTMVKRLMQQVSVRAETMDTRLYPRRVNMPATLEVIPATSSTKTDKVWRVTSCGAGISLRSPLRFRELSPDLQQLIHFHQIVGADQRRTEFLHSRHHRKSSATPGRLRQR